MAQHGGKSADILMFSTYYFRVLCAQACILCWAILKLLYLEYHKSFSLEN